MNDVVIDDLALLKAYFRERHEDDSLSSLSLFTGLSGRILIQSILYEHTLDLNFKAQIERNVSLLINKMEQDTHLSSTFADGVAGVGWLLLYLKERELIEIESDEFLDDIDDFLKDALENFLVVKNFDILHGALGIGLYFLKRGVDVEVIKIIKMLYASREVEDDEVKWRQFNKISQSYVYDFGLAHGQASILYFFGKCFIKSIEPELCSEMITGILKCYSKNTLDYKITGAYFPSLIPVSDYINYGGKKNTSRLAWCYGDLGILHTMYLISIWCNNNQSKELEAMLLNVSKQRKLDECMVVDAQLCHGSAGASYIFLNLFGLTGNIEFKKAADFWKEETFKFGNDKRKGLLGYLFDTGYIGYQSGEQFLTGMGGVLVALISFDNLSISDWNESLFLS